MLTRKSAAKIGLMNLKLCINAPVHVSAQPQKRIKPAKERARVGGIKCCLRVRVIVPLIKQCASENMNGQLVIFAPTKAKIGILEAGESESRLRSQQEILAAAGQI